MTRIVAIEIGGPVEPWRTLGLDIDHEGTVVGSAALRFGGGEAGIRRVLVDDPDGSLTVRLPAGPSRSNGPADLDVSSFEIDGAPWGVDAAPSTTVGSAERANHPIGATRIDHVVLMTPYLHRTCGAIESTLGEPLKRVRDAGDGVQQGFFRLGDVIVEVVESPQVPAGPAAWWGLVLIVDDLDEVTSRLGPDVVSAPRGAVQPGRFIASVRGSVGLGMPVALMSR